MDYFSLTWSLFITILGAVALWRSKSIIHAMRTVSEKWWLEKGFKMKELEESMAFYTNLFGIVWISCGLFWTLWILYRWKYH
jgi:hypothetical protein